MSAIECWMQNCPVAIEKVHRQKHPPRLAPPHISSEGTLDVHLADERASPEAQHRDNEWAATEGACRYLYDRQPLRYCEEKYACEVDSHLDHILHGSGVAELVHRGSTAAVERNVQPQHKDKTRKHENKLPWGGLGWDGARVEVVV